MWCACVGAALLPLGAGGYGSQGLIARLGRQSSDPQNWTGFGLFVADQESRIGAPNQPIKEQALHQVDVPVSFLSRSSRRRTRGLTVVSASIPDCQDDAG